MLQAGRLFHYYINELSFIYSYLITHQVIFQIPDLVQLASTQTVYLTIEINVVKRFLYIYKKNRTNIQQLERRWSQNRCFRVVIYVCSVTCKGLN